MQENRKHTRKKVEQELTVTDMDSEKLLGHVVDISCGGLMVLTEDPLILPGAVFRLHVELPGHNEGIRSICVDAESLWREPGNDPQKYRVGFQFIDISEEHVCEISRLIENPA